jgi:hypothetical protein
MAASPPKIWFSANTGISKCGRARAETFKALPPNRRRAFS